MPVAVFPAPQPMRALSRANRIRSGRAQLKRDVRSGQTLVADVLEDPPECAVTMTVYELVCAQRHWGHERTRRLLREVPVSELKQVGQLTDRQRLALIVRLG